MDTSLAVGFVLAIGFAAALALLVSVLFVGTAAIPTYFRREWVPIGYSIRSLGARKLTTVVTLGGVALVVAVFTASLMLGSGIEQTLISTGDPLNAKVIRKGTKTEIDSTILAEQERMLASDPAVALGRTGAPLVSPELVILIFARRAGSSEHDDGANLAVRGVGPQALELHMPDELEGRMFKPGTNEIIIGSSLAGRFEGAHLGGKMKFGLRDWTVVGIADHGGSAFDSEIWGDVDQMGGAFNRRPSTVTLRLKNSSDIDALAARMAREPRLNGLEVMREPDFWEALSWQFARFVTLLGIVVAVIFAAGAILGAMTTMYAQVNARTRDIGTLRAIGFKRRAVLVSFVVESVLLALCAGGIGILAAGLLRYVRFSTTNWQTNSEIAFSFQLTPTTVLAAAAFSAIIGYAGGILPAWRASRIPIATAFRVD